MNIHRTIADRTNARSHPESQDQSIGFVPTMGALHAGHRALLERARQENDRVVLSLFVNPTQFNDLADLQKYPRMLEADLALAAGLVTDVFVPAAAELYPDHYQYRATEQHLSQELEGTFRPGHFAGMLTFVLKLLKLVRPTRAYFGEKDWQQLQLVQGMVRAFFLRVEIVACPTVRDDDGVALSSRNFRLSEAGRSWIRLFPKILRETRDATTAKMELKFARFEVDYVADRNGVRLGAVRLEGVRLINNVRL